MPKRKAEAIAVVSTTTEALDHPSRFQFVGPSLAGRSRSTIPVVSPGESIPVEPGFLRGHGTTVRSDGLLVATVAGVVEHVNKLVSVRPLRARYHGEVGDVVVCRIVEVGAKRWKADPDPTLTPTLTPTLAPTLSQSQSQSLRLRLRLRLRLSLSLSLMPTLTLTITLTPTRSAQSDGRPTSTQGTANPHPNL